MAINGSTTPNNTTTPQSSTGSTSGLVSHAKEVATHVSDKARSLVDNEISQTQKRSLDDLGGVARALRSTRKELGDNPASPIVDVAADQIERASRFLQRASIDDVIVEVETFARREPLLFLGGAFALGIFGARFLKSSGRRDMSRAPAEPLP